MKEELKFYLLAEEGGWDCSQYAFQYKNTLFQSDAYKVLQVNVLQAKNHLSKKAMDIVKGYESLSQEPQTLRDVFIEETTLNYLALHSFSEYYLNPLAINPNYSGELTTLGELIYTIQGKDMSINEIIADETIPLENKKREIKEQCDGYLRDMNQLVYRSLNIIQKRAFSKDDSKKSGVIAILDAIIFGVLNFILAFLFLYPFFPFRNVIYHPDPSKAMTYLCYLEPIIIFLYDLFFILFHGYRCNISEPYNYARRFLKKNTKRVFQDLEKGRDDLYNYLCGAINNRILLKGDIKDFSKLSSSYVDFDKVVNVSELKNRKMYRVLHSLSVITLTLACLISLVTLMVYLVGLLYQTAI